jgi:pimeloyl-ACP methyl ester carboxylesterase
VKRNGCVLKTTCALILLFPFSFIQAPSEDFGARQLKPSSTLLQKLEAAGPLATNKITLAESQEPGEVSSPAPATLICFFSHGIADTYRQAQKYVEQYEDSNGQIHTNSRYTIPVPTRAFNYPDATQRFWRVNFWRTNLGQDQDVLTLKRALERLKEQNPNIEVILYGVSRGASTIINFLAEFGAERSLPAPFDTPASLDTIASNHSGRADQELRRQPGEASGEEGASGGKRAPLTKSSEKTRALAGIEEYPGEYTQSDTISHTPATLPRIRAVVLESPYDDIASVARYLAKRTYIDKVPYCHDYGHQAVHSIIGTIFINYNKNGLSPIKSAPKVPKDIPILIICSEQDQLVPWSSSCALYQELKNSGHKHTHLLKLQKGLHAKLLAGPEGANYQETVHSFYKQYGLPYNKSLLVTQALHLEN